MTLSVTNPETLLRISEIFYSLQGETTFSGLPTVFVRLTGCPLRCSWCDSEYAFQGGERMSLLDIAEQVKTFKTPYVTVTGGEPLAQANVNELLTLLCDKGFTVSLETSGALPVEHVEPRVITIMDIKAPSSNESERNLWANLDHLSSSDQIKCVIASEEDYSWFKNVYKEYKLTEKVNTILVSPAFKQIDPVVLANWILEDGLSVRYQLQLHKQLWGDKQGV